MSAFERKSSVSKFVKRWSNRGYEKGEAQPFWLSLLRDVFNISEPETFISFEDPIPRDLRDAHKKTTAQLRLPIVLKKFWTTSRQSWLS